MELTFRSWADWLRSLLLLLEGMAIENSTVKVSKAQSSWLTPSYIKGRCHLHSTWRMSILGLNFLICHEWLCTLDLRDSIAKRVCDYLHCRRARSKVHSNKTWTFLHYFPYSSISPTKVRTYRPWTISQVCLCWSLCTLLWACHSLAHQRLSSV